MTGRVVENATSPRADAWPSSDARGALELRPFDKLFAPTVASWLPDPREHFWVAPSTPAPLTAAKVVGWIRPEDRPLLLFAAGHLLPYGYAELNPMKADPAALWIGHLVVDPVRRRRGVGAAFVRLLVQTA